MKYGIAVGREPTSATFDTVEEAQAAAIARTESDGEMVHIMESVDGKAEWRPLGNPDAVDPEA
jgi:hypothetical protein